MHPAYSVIFFTTASGLGYGMLFLSGLAAALGLVPADRWLGAALLGTALVLITFGLLASTYHLGHPERAWRAFSQWRSSWLSREGVASVFTYGPALALAWSWLWLETTANGWAAAGWLAAAGAAITVYCTGMIYASLRAIPRWSHPLVPPNYLALALATGAVWFDTVLRLFGEARPAATWLAVAAVALAAALKLGYWRGIDRAAPEATAETATGLGGLGAVRLFESPHTEPNYLQKEMGYRVARKHAERLRRISAVLLFAAPVVLAILALAVGGAAATAAMAAAALSAAVGVVIERWLFFAEAVHVVSLYYGTPAA